MSSDNYAGRLSEYKNKGICGLPEKNETKRSLEAKLKRLIQLVKESKHTTVITGAGISTNAGIPDFRGPKGIWTLENKQKQTMRKSKKRKLTETSSSSNDTSNATTTSTNVAAEMTPSASFETAKPTLTHRAITFLSSDPINQVQYTITQNVDGLHMRSKISRAKHCFLHGCIFTEKCEDCKKEFFRDYDIQGISFQYTGRICDSCNGKLRDTILDWEDDLPEDDWQRAQAECEQSDLILALGTSLRIQPVGDLPTWAKKGFVIVNKQETPYDGQAEMRIAADVDLVMDRLLKGLGYTDWDEPMKEQECSQTETKVENVESCIDEKKENDKRENDMVKVQS